MYGGRSRFLTEKVLKAFHARSFHGSFIRREEFVCGRVAFLNSSGHLFDTDSRDKLLRQRRELLLGL